MDIRQENHPLYYTSQFESLGIAFNQAGITYKSNEVLHRISQIKGYPYLLLLHMTKQFHMNQFEILFYSHILNDDDNCFNAEPVIFQSNMELNAFNTLYSRLDISGKITVTLARLTQREQPVQGEEEQQPIPSVQTWEYKQLKRLFIIKYYLNESMKPYEEQLKQIYPQFFTKIFNNWVDKYSNKVLRTNPRKINQFYIEIFQTEESAAIDNADIDCHYRNYNEIVDELIKATSDGEEGYLNLMGRNFETEQDFDA